MDRMRITSITPVSDQIILLIFQDTRSKLYDAKYLLHRLPGINPKSDPECFNFFLRQNEHVVSEWIKTLGCSTPSPAANTIEVTLSFERDEWSEIEAACVDLNITAEQLAAALVRFCAEPGAKEALSQWHSTIRQKRETI